MLQQMVPLPSFSDFVRSLEDLPRLDNGYKLNSILLYTEEDIDLAKFVREHYDELDAMSGSAINVYVIERPPDNRKKQDSSAFWKAKLDKETFLAWGRKYGFFYNRPYNKADAYTIARKLGIFPDQFPCIALLDSIEQTNKIVIPIKGDYSTFFRNCFSILQGELRDVYGDLLHKRWSMIDKMSWVELEKIFRTKLYDSVIKSLENTENEKHADRTIYNNFYGNTVYVNHPHDEVNFENFQNTDKSND